VADSVNLARHILGGVLGRLSSIQRAWKG
jgi:hypothetical protein